MVVIKVIGVIWYSFGMGQDHIGRSVGVMGMS